MCEARIVSYQRAVHNPTFSTSKFNYNLVVDASWHAAAGNNFVEYLGAPLRNPTYLAKFTEVTRLLMVTCVRPGEGDFPTPCVDTCMPHRECGTVFLSADWSCIWDKGVPHIRSRLNSIFTMAAYRHVCTIAISVNDKVQEKAQTLCHWG